MSLDEDQLRQRLGQLADHARRAPTRRFRPVPLSASPPMWPRWAIAGAVAVAAAVLASWAIVGPGQDNGPRVVHSGPVTQATQPGSPTVAPSVAPTLPATAATPPSTSATTSGATVVPPLDPPDATLPTAGACGQAQGVAGTVTIAADMVPQPRCLIIRHDQRLSVTNNSGRTLAPTLGPHLRLVLVPGQTATFAGTLGAHLAPGVHHLVFSSVSVGDIWVDAVCLGPGTVNCTTP